MQARSARDFLRMLDPKDGSFGVEHMSGSSDRERLKKYICNNVSKFPSNYQPEIMKFKNAVPVIALPAAIIKYYKGNPLIYATHMIDSGVLDVPPQLKNLNVSQLKERLKPVCITKYILKCGESNFGYKNAAKMLQEKSGLTGGGGKFDKYTGRRIYEKIRNKLPKGKGYFASEADSDLLFSPPLEEFIYYIDEVVWKTLDLDIKYCAKDSNSVWKPKTNSSWTKDALKRGWGPVSKKEYDRRMKQILNAQNKSAAASVNNKPGAGATGIGKLLYDLALENKLSLAFGGTRTLFEIEEPGIKLEIDLTVAGNSNNSATIGIGNEDVETDLLSGLKAKWSREGKFTTEQSMEIKDYKFEAGITVGLSETTIYVGIEYTPGKSIGPSVGLASLITVNNLQSLRPWMGLATRNENTEDSFDFDIILEYAKAALAKLDITAGTVGALATILMMASFAIA